MESQAQRGTRPDIRERQKDKFAEMKEQELTPTEGHRHTEDHHDDLGNHLTGLGPVQDNDDDGHCNFIETDDEGGEHTEALQLSHDMPLAPAQGEAPRSCMASFSELLNVLVILPSGNNLKKRGDVPQ